MALANRADSPKFETQERVNLSQTMTENFAKTYRDMALTHDAFIPCTATYDGVTKRHTLVPTQSGIELPEVFTLRFTAAAAFTAGDKIYISGKEYAPAYTDSADAAITGVWLAGVPVGITCVQAVAKAFVGTSMAHKANNTLGFAEGDILEWAMAQTCAGGFIVNPDIVTGLPDNHWFNAYLVFPFEGVRLIKLINNYTGAEYTNQINSGQWMGWTDPLATATPPQEFSIPFINGLSADEFKNVYWKNQLNEVTILCSYKKSGTSDDIPNTTQIMSLPPAYYPSKTVKKSAQVICDSSGQPGGFLQAQVIVNTNGGVSVSLPIHVPYKAGNFEVTFVAGGQN